MGRRTRTGKGNYPWCLPWYGLWDECPSRSKCLSGELDRCGHPERSDNYFKEQAKWRDLYKCRNCGRYTPHEYLYTREDKTAVYRCTRCGALKYIYQGTRDYHGRSMGWR